VILCISDAINRNTQEVKVSMRKVPNTNQKHEKQLLLPTAKATMG
jgi:hypothetical protein